MTCVRDVVAFTVVLEGSAAREFDLRRGEGRVLKIGRYPKNDVVLDHPGISNQHVVLKLIGSRESELGICDLSSNGTGLKLPGDETVQRLPKGVDTPLLDGALVIMPMHVKDLDKNGGESGVQRKCFTVHFTPPENGPADEAPVLEAPPPAAEAEPSPVELPAPAEQAVSTRRGRNRRSAGAESRPREANEGEPVHQDRLRGREERRREKRLRREEREERRRQDLEQQERRALDEQEERAQQEQEAQHEPLQVQEREPARGQAREHRRGKRRKGLDREEEVERKRQRRAEKESREGDGNIRHPRRQRRRAVGRTAERERLEEALRQDILAEENRQKRELERLQQEAREEEERLRSHREERDRFEQEERSRKEREQLVVSIRRERERQEREERERLEREERERLLVSLREERERQEREDCERDERERQEREEREYEERLEREHEERLEREREERLAREREELEERLELERLEREREERLQRERREVREEREHEECEEREEHEEQEHRELEEERLREHEASDCQVREHLAQEMGENRDRQEAVDCAAEGQEVRKDAVRSQLPDGVKSTRASQKPAGPQQSAATLPQWVSLGAKLRWWSESQNKHHNVRVSKVDEKQRLVFVTFELNSKVWKSVPFSLLGRSSCPLLPPAGSSTQGPSSADGIASLPPQVQARVSQPRSPTSRRTSLRSRSKTPEWWQMESKMTLEERLAEQEREKRRLEEQKRREQERLREERRRKELVEAEQRKVQEAFEQRKREAEERKLREEEEWRQRLREQREQEAAEEALEHEEEMQKEREERRKKRKEERAKREEAERKRREAEAKERKRQEAEENFERLNREGAMAKEREEKERRIAEEMRLVQEKQAKDWRATWEAGWMGAVSAGGAWMGAPGAVPGPAWSPDNLRPPFSHPAGGAVGSWDRGSAPMGNAGIPNRRVMPPVPSLAPVFARAGPADVGTAPLGRGCVGGIPLAGATLQTRSKATPGPRPDWGGAAWPGGASHLGAGAALQPRLYGGY
mmetsp:Transcript_57671/g.134338  ORF Transcript_57671/g.134338 Transcript_57671/m.134338 type:complete len:1012 (-) Transcript_57671:75-3110(-)